MNTNEQADEIENRGFDYLYQERWGEARGCFQEMLLLSLSPIRQVKVLINIMGAYEKEGNIPEAIASCNKALEIIEAYNLYEATAVEGAMLRGSIRGHLARLKRKPILTNVPEYSDSGPLEMNLSFVDRLRAHFAIASIGAALGATIGSQLPYPQLEIGWLDGNTKTISLLGAILSWFMTNNILELATESVFVLTGRDKRYCLQGGLNLLTLVGLLYIIVMPFILSEVIEDIAPFILFLVLTTVGLIALKYRKGTR